jgi:hypothetical protein
MFQSVSRRRFLKGAAAAGVTVLAGTFRRTAYAANEKLNCACIGAAGRGGSHVEAAAKMENLVAVCDVDEGRLAGAAKKHPGAKPFADYRKMFDEMAKGIDAVFVGTPDHTHFPASMMAIGHGKHCYCEKPLTLTVWEARTVAEAARKAKVATQMGNQGMSSDGTRLMVEFIQAGAVGKVTEVHVWTDRAAGWWPQGRNRPAYTDPVPAGLNWDLWLGTAPERPYASVWREPEFQNEKKQVYHPFVWRGWCDFGTGALGDIACHAMGPVFWALKLDRPTAVEAKCEGGTAEMFPLWSIITYEFAARGDLPPVKIIWYDGKKMPPRPDELEADRKWPNNGRLFVGDKGKLLFEEAPRLLPESKMKEYQRPDPTLPRIPGGDHHLDFFTACKGGRPACSNFPDVAGPLAESVLVGNLAIRLGKRIEWDGPAMKAKNCPQADALIRRPYRPGWLTA